MALSGLQASAPSTVALPTVLVTRPADQAAQWVEQFVSQGIAAEVLPLIGIAPMADPAPLQSAWTHLQRYALVMFVSPNAALQFFAHRPAGVVWPESAQAASPGPGTTAILRGLGVPSHQLIEPAADAPQFDSEALWQRLSVQSWQGRPALVVAGEDGRDWLAQQLRSHGALVDRLLAYRRVPAPWTTAQVVLAEKALVNPQHHLWFFSSSEAVANLLLRYPPPAWARSRALATHPRIAQTAREAGFIQVLAAHPVLEAVVGCIQSAANPPAP